MKNQFCKSLTKSIPLVIFFISLTSLKGDSLNVYDVASFSADHIVVIDKKEDEISERLLKYSGISANKEKLSVIKYSDDEMPDFIDIADQLDKIIKKISS